MSHTKRNKGAKGGSNDAEKVGTMLPALPPRKATQVFRPTTPPSNGSILAQVKADVAARGMTRAPSMFHYNALGNDFSDMDMSSDINAQLRKEMQKKKTENKSQGNKKKHNQKHKSKRDDGGGAGEDTNTTAKRPSNYSDDSSSSRTTTPSSGLGRAAALAVAGQHHADVAIIAEDDDDGGNKDEGKTNAGSGDGYGGDGEEEDYQEYDDLEEQDEDDVKAAEKNEEEEEAVVPKKTPHGSKGSSRSPLPTLGVLAAKVEQSVGLTPLNEPPPAFAVDRSATSPTNKINFQIDFRKVNFKRMHEEKQKMQQQGGCVRMCVRALLLLRWRLCKWAPCGNE